MAGKNEQVKQEATPEELTQVSDNEILAAAAEIIKNEELAKAKKEADEKEKLEKSEADLKGSEGNKDLAGPSGTQGPVEIQKLYNNGSEGTNTQEEKGVQSMRGDDSKKRPEGEGSGPDANTQEGDNQTEGNEKENRPLKKKGGQEPKDPGPDGKAPDANTQSGSADDKGNKKENRPLEKEGRAINNKQPSLSKSLEGNVFKKDTEVDDKQGRESKDKKKIEVLGNDMNATDQSLGKTQGSEMNSNYRENETRMLKSIEKLSKAVESLSKRFDGFEKKEEELTKSITPGTIEVLAKSYNKQIRKLQEENEDLKKSHGKEIQEVKKSIEDVKEELGKPARTRETISNFDVIEKGNSEQSRQPIYKSKSAVLEKLEELRQEGKVSGDEVISYNASNSLSENARKRLTVK